MLKNDDFTEDTKSCLKLSNLGGVFFLFISIPVHLMFVALKTAIYDFPYHDFLCPVPWRIKSAGPYYRTIPQWVITSLTGARPPNGRLINAHSSTIGQLFCQYKPPDVLG